ncbi:MAG: AMP-binding protein [Pseudorhodoplanes sp.]|nr:AMP-binding protein [Pseudorhodoplanes sp.]
MSSPRPHVWEKSYPPGISWDAPIATTTLPDFLARSVKRNADRFAIAFRGRRIRYRELGEAVERLAAGFIRSGLRKGDALGLYLPNSPHYAIALFAAARAGARVVQLSPLDAERELAHKLEDSGTRVVLTCNVAPVLPTALKLQATGLIGRLIVADDAAFGTAEAPLVAVPVAKAVTPLAALLDAEPPARWPAIAKDEVAVLQYTGGTTGVPKGAMLTHGNLTASCAIYDAWFNPQSTIPPGEARAICALPLFHIFALSTVMLRHLGNGNEVLLRTKFDAGQTLDDIEIGRATHLNGVPTMWIALCNHPDITRRDLSSLVACSSGGGALPVEVAERWQALTGKVLRSGIGMTETAPAAATQPILRPGKLGSSGLPLPGIVIEIVALDDPRRVLPAGATGEIRVRGPNVVSGYWNRPRETAESFVDGFWLSGDIGYLDEDGFLFVVDRKKDMIVSGGFNVYPRVIEEAIFEHPDVEEAVVIGIADRYRGEAAKAFVKLKAGAPALTLDALRAFLADKIGRHEMPAALELRAALPKTSIGKFSKKDLVAEERAKLARAASRLYSEAG